jgi:meiotically up-regulated gene 157 (Mug157) protein
MGLSYNYWIQTGDDSFVNSTVWVNAVQSILTTIQQEQDPTFNITSGIDMNCMYPNAK